MRVASKLGWRLIEDIIYGSQVTQVVEDRRSSLHL